MQNQFVSFPPDQHESSGYIVAEHYCIWADCSNGALFTTSSSTLVQPAGGRFEGSSGRCLVGELFVVRDGSEANSTPSIISWVMVGLSAWNRQRRAVMQQSLSRRPSNRSSESMRPGGSRREVCNVCSTVGILRAGGF